MPTTLTIELPRLDGESARAHRARIEYVTMGPDRSLEKTRLKLAKTSPGYTRVLKEWSARYGWSESAEKYDQELVLITVAEAAEQYRKDLTNYRQRYGEMGRGLYQAAAVLLKRVIEEHKAMSVGPGTLALVSNAARVAADLEALALRVESLLNEPGSE